jgi:hypothetical protein
MSPHAPGAMRPKSNQTEIPEMAADFSLILRHIGLSRNPEAPMRLVDGRRAGRTPFTEPGRVEFSLIETHFSYGLQRTHEKSNALRCRRDGRWPQFRDQPRFSECLGMATSAIWKVT